MMVVVSGMALLHLSDDPVADVDGPLGLVHGLHKVAAVGAQQSQAGLDVARTERALAALGEHGIASRIH